jgi:hypothetical protein
VVVALLDPAPSGLLRSKARPTQLVSENEVRVRRYLMARWHTDSSLTGVRTRGGDPVLPEAVGRLARRYRSGPDLRTRTLQSSQDPNPCTSRHLLLLWGERGDLTSARPLCRPQSSPCGQPPTGPRTKTAKCLSTERPQ